MKVDGNELLTFLNVLLSIQIFIMAALKEQSHFKNIHSLSTHDFYHLKNN